MMDCIVVRKFIIHFLETLNENLPPPDLPPPEFAVKTELPDSRSRVRAVLGALFLTLALTACGGGGGGSINMAPSGLLDLSPATTGYAAGAMAKVADARPRAGSVTQSSNAINNVTQDRVSVTATYGATRNSYSVQNGSDWSITTADGNPVSIPIRDSSSPFKGSELYKRTNGGTLYVDVYSDIEAPETRQTDGGSDGARSVPLGTTILSSGTNITVGGGITGDGLSGSLNGESGRFTCSGGCQVRSGITTAGTWTFTPARPPGGTTTSTPDTDYLAGGVWLFIPDNATSVDDVESGAFADGSDLFRQSNLTALTGTADYNGAFAGLYADKSEGEINYIDGAVNLTADFGGASDLGTIRGRATDIHSDDYGRLSGSITLGQANIGSSNSGFFEGRLNGAVEGIDYNGRWGGQFAGNGEPNGEPGSVGGTFGGRSTDGNVSFVGAYVGYHEDRR